MKPNVSTSPTAQTTALAGVSLALGLLFDWLFYGKIPGISVVIYVVAIMGGLFALAAYLGRRLPAPALWLLLPLGFFAAMVAVRASHLLALLNILASLALLLLVARLTFRDDLRRFNLADYAKIPFLPLKFLRPLTRTVAEFFALRSAVKNHPLAVQITRGVLLAIPVLIVFVTLFASADLVFQKYAIDAFNLKLNSTAVAQTLLVTFVTLAFTGAYSYIFRQPEDESPDAAPATARLRLGKIEIAILLGAVNVLFFLFILVQLAYLFGGLSNISGQGFTYAEYARKGFFELLAVAMVAFGMLWAADKTVAKTTAGHSLAFRLLSSALITQVILIMVSAFKRLYLYEQAYGFTTLRLYSHGFVIFLAVIFVLLLVKILRNQAENHFAFPAFITAIVFLAALNVLNPDAFIARQNLDRFHQTGKLDGVYFGGLSEDALPEVKTAIDVTTGDTKQQLIDSLATRSEPSDWQSWNLARSRAGSIIDNYPE
ncbi:MAG TPA: DUF4173 domain-containing protein [Candidatus Saccharimonadia bacterium]|nr:DUF4173 domain-containing protein [Candidatus Saccharimonadia bacterium]